MNPRERFERILAGLHEAMLDEAHWVATSALIDEACVAKGNHLVLHTTGTAERNDAIEPLFMRFCYRGEHRSEWEQEYLANDTRAGMIQLDRCRRIVGANDRARELFRQGALLPDMARLFPARGGCHGSWIPARHGTGVPHR